VKLPYGKTKVFGKGMMLDYNLEGKIANGRATVYAIVHSYLELLMLPLLVLLPWQTPYPFPTLCSILVHNSCRITWCTT
jgi:hypothetical protein